MRTRMIAILAVAVLLTAGASVAQEQKKIVAGDGQTTERHVKRVVIKDGKVLEGDGDVVVLRPGEAFGRRAFLGVSTMSLSSDLRAHYGVPGDAGVLVSTITAESPAAKAGLRAGDIITAVDGKKVDSPAAIMRVLREKQKGDQVRVDFRRNGVNQQAFATLDQREGISIPEFRFDPETLREPLVIAGDAVKDIEAYFSGPQWKARVESLQDCGKAQVRIQELEKRLAELEKKLNQK